METALTEPRYMVTLVGQGKRLMIAPKLAQIIAQLQQKKTLEEAAQELSLLWGREVDAEVLRSVIEQQMVPRGMACPSGQAPPMTPAARRLEAGRRPLAERLLVGQFYWRLLPPKLVGKICSPLTFCYEWFSVLLAVLMIVATRWLLYTTFDGGFIRQVMTEFTPNEYLMSLLLLVAVVLVHEFGHAAAQLRYGLPAGGIGFQLFHYIPAFFANVDASWGLKPHRRIVVDIGGIYFQALAGSVLFLVYLKTGSLPVLTTIVVSDVLILIALNPFLRFDGYWLVADVLAVPNLQVLSKKLLAQYWKRLRGVPGGADLPPLSKARARLVVAYGLLRKCFWLVVAVLLVLRARHIFAGVWGTLYGLAALELEGLRTGNLSLIAASLIRLVLFSLVILALGTVLVRTAWEWSKSVNSRLRGALQRRSAGAVESVVRG
jgi:putative peptide zinc metalloprotease protein